MQNWTNTQERVHKLISYSHLWSDGHEGWPVYSCAPAPDKFYVPADFESKKPISQDDITNLVIELETKSFRGFLSSPYAFVKDYKEYYCERNKK